MAGNEALTAYVAAFVDELVQAGATRAVISPGSRSTPLAMTMAEHPQMQIWMHVDERSAGFFALGMAKAQRSPVVLVCSSGTAAANYFPAVVEANQARVPLIVCTADRPHELRDVGAPQAIQQIGLYGTYAKWFIEMALPEQTPDMLRYARMAATRAVAAANNGPQGPVHLNLPFREPLIPDFSDPSIWQSGRKVCQQSAVYTKVTQGSRFVAAEKIRTLATELMSVERGLIVCGPYDRPELAEAVIQLAEILQYPVFADPLSQVRFGPHDANWIIDTYDTFLREEQVAQLLRPDVVIRFGAMPVSKAFLLYLKRYPKCRQIIVEPDQGWMEPTLLASDMMYADPVAFCQELAACISSISIARQVSGKFGQIIREMNTIVKQQIAFGALSENSESDQFLNEGQVFFELTKNLPAGSTLFVGNSMPIRDLDTYGMCQNRSIRILANRGANGIDGVVSSALGASTVDQPLVLAIGDLSFFHDLNGLLAAKLHKLHATIILINNDGGGIFSFLPQAQHPGNFETLFGTPIGLDFRKAVEMYGGSFTTIHSWNEFRTEVNKAIFGKGLNVIEVRTERKENLAMHRDFWHDISLKLREYADGVASD